MKMNLQVKGIKQEKSADVANLFLDKQEYSTSAIYERVKDNGKEFIRGYFYSAKKTNSHNSLLTSKGEKEAKTIELCTTNNQMEHKDDLRDYLHSNSNLQTKFFPILKILIILAFILIVFHDLFSYFKHIGDENIIERYQCEKEYYENECDKISIHDGPIINKFCKEKEICMNIKYTNVYFHSVLIKYIKEIAMNFVPTSLFSKIAVTLGLIIGLIVIKKII